MSPKRRPGSTRPIRTREVVLSRHALISRLYSEPTIALCLKCGQSIQRQRTLKEMARLVGVDYTTVWWHLTGKCRCGL